MNIYDRSFRRLIVWREAKKLTINIYQMTKRFPKEEKYSMTNQMRRAANSIMANIAEGNERKSKNDCCRFLEVARGSLVEVDCFIDLAYELTYLSDTDFKTLSDQIAKTGYLLHQFSEAQERNPMRK
ncbi:MAG: four helix bundle protein [bacterium]|nr:four helix bundle protein [bacterium]